MAEVLGQMVVAVQEDIYILMHKVYNHQQRIILMLDRVVQEELLLLVLKDPVPQHLVKLQLVVE